MHILDKCDYFNEGDVRVCAILRGKVAPIIQYSAPLLSEMLIFDCGEDGNGLGCVVYGLGLVVGMFEFPWRENSPARFRHGRRFLVRAWNMVRGRPFCRPWNMVRGM